VSVLNWTRRNIERSSFSGIRQQTALAANGVDMITFNDDGSLITHFKVMVRPLKAINLLHRLIGEQLAKP
jgi:hypothetical protein